MEPAIYRPTLEYVIGEIIGPDLLIVLLIALVVFGGSQIPKLARGLGSAHREFQKGLAGDGDEPAAAKPAAPVTDAVADKELPAPPPAAQNPPPSTPSAAPNGQSFT